MEDVGSAHTLMVATLAAMSEFSQGLRRGAPSPGSAQRVARCLEALADCAGLAPTLRRECEQLASLWLLLHPGAASRPAPCAGTRRGATVLPFRRPAITQRMSD